ncbi:MAG: Rpn family recombination-promoting nuclease/putative transposase, partial [Deltaproteobacteria bacterium]|nr:Rpn family recombination-promoting nuclease/putative transposase [Deltaproteobacteria bacterium]
MLFAAPENRDILIALLTAVLRPASPIRSVEVRNPEVTRRAVQDKGIVLDLLVELEDGTMFDVEMQAQKRPGFRNRALYYWARIFAQVLPVGESYVALVPVISVLFLDYEEFSRARMHSTFQILEVHDHERFSDRLEIHVIELPKLAKLTDLERNAERDLVDWSRFLRANSDEEIREVCMHNPAIKKANQALEALSARPKARRLAR